MKRIFLFLLVIFLFGTGILIIGSQDIHAKERTTLTLDESQDVIFTFIYDKEEPQITLVSPDGTKYKKDKDYAKVDRETGGLYLYIKDASAGDWTINYDKKNNTVLDASIVSWYGAVSIDTLKVSEPKDDVITVQVKVFGIEDDYANYYIYAILPDETGGESGQIELSQGSIFNEDNFEEEVSIEQLPDGIYYIKLEVVVNGEGDVEISDELTSDKAISISGHTKEGNNENIMTVFNEEQGSLYVDWSNARTVDFLDKEIDHWLIGVFQNGSMLYYSTYEKDVTNARINVDMDNPGNFSVSIYALEQGVICHYSLEFPWDSGVFVTIETSEITKDGMFAVKYDTGDLDVFAQVTVGERIENFSWKGASISSMTLDNLKTNEVSVRYGIQKNIYYEITRRISVDAVPPAIDLYGVRETMSTEDKSITLSGRSEKGVTLTINGTQYEVNEDGTFTVTLPVEDGENKFTFVVKDAAENQATRTLVINKNKSKTGNDRGYYQLLIAFVATLILGAILVLIGLRMGSFAFFVSFNVEVMLLSLGGIGYLIYRYNQLTEQISGESLAQLLMTKPLSEITDILDMRKETLWYILLPAAVFLVFLIITILMFILKNKLRKLKESKKTKTENK